LGNLLKAHLNKPVVGASEELLRERLKEPLEKLLEELPKELRERPHRPCKWL
jgi:predicted RNase H-like HicB family nuclease